MEQSGAEQSVTEFIDIEHGFSKLFFSSEHPRECPQVHLWYEYMQADISSGQVASEQARQAIPSVPVVTERGRAGILNSEA